MIHGLDDDDVETRRAEIRRYARADRIQLRTGFNDGVVWGDAGSFPRYAS